MRAWEFIAEMPMVAPKANYYIRIKMDIDELIEHNSNPVINITNNLRKMQGRSIIYYWYENEGIIQIGIQINIDANNKNIYKISLVGKLLGSKEFYAEQLYIAVLKDIKTQNENNILFSLVLLHASAINCLSASSKSRLSFNIKVCMDKSNLLLPRVSISYKCVSLK